MTYRQKTLTVKNCAEKWNGVQKDTEEVTIYFNHDIDSETVKF